MHRQQFMNERQPNSAAFMRAPARMLHTAKTLKQVRQFLLWNPCSRIANLEFNVVLFIDQLDFNGAVKCGFQCI